MRVTDTADGYVLVVDDSDDRLLALVDEVLGPADLAAEVG